ncbi:prolipoprotein diacylglyceryl transferase [Candidatus Omnitrophota bacterium]
MHPILLSIGNIRVYSYGLMLAIGFLVASFLASKRAHVYNIEKDTVSNLGFLFLVSGIIGARLFYVILNMSYFSSNPFEVFFIHRGGLVFYGGFISAALSGVIFAKLSKLSILNTGDLAAPFIPLAHSFGRIGCFLNGCCYGKPTTLFFGVLFPYNDAKVYPTQAISSVGLFLIFILLFNMQKKRRFKGQIFISYFITYAILRFITDFFRGDPSPMYLGMTIAQLLSLIIMVASIILYIKLKNQKSNSKIEIDNTGLRIK